MGDGNSRRHLTSRGSEVGLPLVWAGLGWAILPVMGRRYGPNLLPFVYLDKISYGSMVTTRQSTPIYPFVVICPVLPHLVSRSH